ncbi:xyloside transporter XynT [Lentilactobacillus farraginis DSM 18382 = JCM 14108]|uniref:Xyloside transporter XynT n=1 Tax=Lentilactobacillus farraginis DSM 18382 = JCM 14108 TaxID=1423743 RepID=X0PB57_9LACO|nr:xyloside transporter XynT [Lentilactobacillus farraginis DSM 18382 = JCM 14108]
MKMTQTLPKESAALTDSEHITNKERLSYGASDFACNVANGMVGTYLMYYYTDVFGLAAGAIGTLFFIARIVDAISGPTWGIMIDRTHTRWGKSRPYFLWFSVPYAIFFILAFSSVPLGPLGKLIWAYVTYIAIDILYLGINIPITSMLPSLTASPQERVKFSTVRQVLATTGATLISIAVLPAVQLLGNGNDKQGFLVTAIIVAVLTAFLLLVTFKNTHERVHPKHQTKLSLKQSASALKGNWPWMIISLMYFFFWIGMQTKLQVTVYFFKYNMHNADLASFMLGLQALSLVVIVFTPFLTKHFGKKGTMVIGLGLCVISQLILGVGAKMMNVPILAGATILGYFGNGFFAGLLPVMLADTVDYGEWKNGVRQKDWSPRSQGLLPTLEWAWVAL